MMLSALTERARFHRRDFSFISAVKDLGKKLRDALYNLPADESESDETLRNRLAAFYATRTLTKLAVRPQDCAEALVWLASERSSRTTGHVIPVDGGLSDAILR